MVTIAQVYISKKERYPDFFVTGKLLFLSYIVFFKTALNSKFDSKRTCPTGTPAIVHCSGIFCRKFQAFLLNSSRNLKVLADFPQRNHSPTVKCNL